MGKGNYTIRLSIILSTFVFICLLAACGNGSQETSEGVDKEKPSSEIADNLETTSGSDTQEETENLNENSQKNQTGTEDEAANDDSNNTEAEPSTTESLKEDYLEKLNETKIEAEKLEAEDSSTYALKAVEDFKYEIWDDLLNDIYSVLEEQLSAEKMDTLRAEQREWIEFRDATALATSKEYEGGTQEHLEYSAVLAKLTEERCYDLVEMYMP